MYRLDDDRVLLVEALQKPVTCISGVKAAKARALNEMGIATLVQLMVAPEKKIKGFGETAWRKIDEVLKLNFNVTRQEARTTLSRHRLLKAARASVISPEALEEIADALLESPFTLNPKWIDQFLPSSLETVGLLGHFRQVVGGNKVLRQEFKESVDDAIGMIYLRARFTGQHPEFLDESMDVNEEWVMPFTSINLRQRMLGKDIEKCTAHLQLRNQFAARVKNVCLEHLQHAQATISAPDTRFALSA